MQTDVVLFKAHVKPELVQTLTLEIMQDLVGHPLSALRVAAQQDVDQASGTVLCYVYARPDDPYKLGKKQRAKIAKRWQKLAADKAAMTCRLVRALDCQGASSTDMPSAHYVVETDTDKGWFEEIVAWYDTEHMPGLAAVPGTVHAVRFINLDDGPKSVACYDLKDQSVFGSPAWLDVRATAWSSHCRPHFKNTLRTMFALIT